MLLPFMVGAQESVNMTFFSNFDLPNLPTRFGAEYNDCWGYHANGTEIAILGGIEDIFFIDVTSPANPQLIYTHHVTNINGTTNQSLWRDFKTYQNYAYASADEGDSGLLIFDLSDIPDTVTLITQTNASWSRAHNIYIDEANGRLYAAGSNTQSNGLKVLNLAASPTNPPQIGAIALDALGGGYVHDVHVRNNIAYCSHGSLHKIQGYNMTNLSNISVVCIIDDYPEEGYNHSSWLNESGTMLVMADETHGSDLKLVDITDPLNISSDDITTFYSELEGPGAPGSSVAHNPFIKGNLAYIAYYHDGVQVFNISDPENIELLAYYDTFDNTDYIGYDGCWGVYPFLPSGIIIGSDQNNGLFVMEVTSGSLGVDFLAFDAKRKEENILLQWTIDNATFGNRFEIKRSEDNGKTFKTIGTVKLDDEQSHYTFLDQDVVTHHSYLYRIDFIELDGGEIKSPVRTVIAGEGVVNFNISNPVSTTIHLEVLKPFEHLDLVLYDMEGRLVWSHKIDNPKASNEIGIEKVIPGQYLLSINWLGGNESKLIQVIR